MLIRYIDKDLTAGPMAVVDRANEIVEEYQGQGIVLTLRALYYRFVSRYPLVLDPSGEHPNTQQNYKRLGDILNKARLYGHVSWHALEDRTRNLVSLPHWATPAELLQSAREQYRIDMWANQPKRFVLLLEKDAGIGTIEDVCRRNDVAYLSCRGNTSQSEMWAQGQRFLEMIHAGQEPVVGYLGDHDPNGVDMTRDVRDRLAMFCGQDIEVRRLLLNLDQVEMYAPPPNPVKNTDSRANGYRRMIRAHNIEVSGDPEHPWDPDTCWEMDALDPSVVVGLVQAAIDDCRDPDLWEISEDQAAQDRAKLGDLIDSLESD